MSIISFKNKFIFLKTKKVAGTSVEAALRPYTGADDIVPCVTPRDEYHSAVNGHYSKNYAVDSNDEAEYTRLVLAEQFDQAMAFLKGMAKRHVSHMDIARIKALVEEHGYSLGDFYVFTIERHPYSWVVSSSAYNNRLYNKGRLKPLAAEEIRELVKRRLNDPQLSKSRNWLMYTIDGKVMVDRVLRYEALDTEIREVLDHLDLDADQWSLPNLKENVRHLDPVDVLDSEIRQRIGEQFKEVFEYMGYAR